MKLIRWDLFAFLAVGDFCLSLSKGNLHDLHTFFDATGTAALAIFGLLSKGFKDN